MRPGSRKGIAESLTYPARMHNGHGCVPEHRVFFLICGLERLLQEQAEQ